MIAAILGTLFNFGWNVLNLQRASKLRRQDHARSEYHRQVVTPVEAALNKLEEFVVELKSARIANPRETGKGILKARQAQYDKLQSDHFQPAVATFQNAVRRAASYTEGSDAEAWFACEDVLDDVLDGFNILRGDAADGAAITRASHRVEKHVHETCAEVRQRMSHQLALYVG